MARIDLSTFASASSEARSQIYAEILVRALASLDDDEEDESASREGSF